MKNVNGLNRSKVASVLARSRKVSVSVMEVCDSRLLLSASLPAVAVNPPPKVEAVYVSSTSWSTAFKNHLEQAGKGSADYGYAIPDGAAQLNTLGWRGLNQVSIQFDELIA